MYPNFIRPVKRNKNKFTQHLPDEKVTVPDGWKDPGPLTKDENPTGLVATSSFSVKFAKYREQYLRDCWDLLSKEMKAKGIKADLNLIEGSMTVSTIPKSCHDPYNIIHSRDVIKMLARSVPYEQARRIYDENIAVEVIRIDNLIAKKERFLKRRDRLIGPNGSTLKALELLTSCYIMVQGCTVTALGPHQSLKVVKRIVEDCMFNAHPVYAIKQLMIKRELAKDPNMVGKDWSKFIPQFKRKTHKKFKPFKIKEKKEYTPFPPPPQKSKVDMMLEDGTYFKAEAARKRDLKKKAIIDSAVVSEERQTKKRSKLHTAPEEPAYKSKKPEASSRVNLNELQMKLKNLAKKN